VKYLHDVTTLRVFDDRCTGCGMCTVVCPHGVLVLENGSASVVDRDACMECGACARNCPVEAVTVRAGVGCAQAVINSALGRGSASCCSLDDYRVPAGEKTPPDPACRCESAGPRRDRTGCC